MRMPRIAAMVLLHIPLAAVAQYQTIDDIRWPDEGNFPAYPREPDERPLKFSVSGGVYYDSNVFRLSDSVNPQTVLGTSQRSDTVGRLGVGVKGDVPIDRQRILFDAALDAYNYKRFGLLDNDSYRAGIAWLWQAGDEWSGDIGYRRTHYLAPLAFLNAPIKDMITTDRFFGSAGYQLTPRWRVRGAADWIQYANSNPTQQTLDNTTSSGTAGLDYVTPASNSVGGQVKYSHGSYPNPQFVVGPNVFVSNTYDEIEASGVVHWVATGVSTLDARLGYTSRRYEQVSQRNFDGVTGRLGWDWTPAGKTLINLAVWRQLQGITELNASYVLSRGISLGPSWAPTVKLVFQARLLYVNNDYLGDPGFSVLPGPTRKDTFRGGMLAVGYSPLRNLQFSLGVEGGSNDSNIPVRSYDYYQVMANARFSF